MATAASMCRNARQAQARRPEAGSRAGGVSRAERGNDQSPKGRNPAGGSMRQHESATGHLPGAGDAHTTSAKSPQTMAVHGVGKMKPSMDIRELHDDDLLAQAKAWRQRALRGEKDARGFAHELEREVRRRFPRNDAPQTLPPIHLLSAVPQPTRRRWKPW